MSRACEKHGSRWQTDVDCLGCIRAEARAEGAAQEREACRQIALGADWHGPGERLLTELVAHTISTRGSAPAPTEADRWRAKCEALERQLNAFIANTPAPLAAPTDDARAKALAALRLAKREGRGRLSPVKWAAVRACVDEALGALEPKP